MDGIHDLGGMAGFGPIEVERDEPTFHEPWEALAFRMNLFSIGRLRAYNADEYRHAVERIAPLHYLSARYYERVLTGVATLLVEKGFVEVADLEGRAGGRFPLANAVVPNADDQGQAGSAPRFQVGDAVRVVKRHPPGHTRVPQYVRGQRGTVLRVAPPFNYPDASAHALPLRTEATYHVAFSARALWSAQDAEGAERTEADSVVVDLWESYLEPVEFGAGAGGE